MRALVTGGAGFIGSTLVDRLLAEEYEVDIIDDLTAGSLANLSEARSLPGRRIRFHQLDVRSPALTEVMSRRPPDVVFHLAAQADVRVSVNRPLFDAEVNILGTLQVLEAARSVGTQRIVFAASGGTLYGEPSQIPTPESAPQKPGSPYGVSKKAAIDYLAAYKALYGIEYCALALANVYGPRQDPHGEAGVVSIFVGNMMSGRRCTIYGDGAQTRDFVYVDDVVEAFFRSATLGSGLYNIGTGIQTSVNELFAVLAHAAGAEEEPRLLSARPGELSKSALEATLAERELGWKAKTSLSSGGAAVVSWMKRQNRV